MTDFHEHDERDVRGVAHEHHTHTANDLGGVPTLADFQRLQDQVGTLTEQCSRLAAQLLAEREVGAAVAGGANTPELIAAAIERRVHLMAGFDEHAYLRVQLRKLAEEIREAAKS